MWLTLMIMLALVATVLTLGALANSRRAWLARREEAVRQDTSDVRASRQYAGNAAAMYALAILAWLGFNWAREKRRAEQGIR